MGYWRAAATVAAFAAVVIVGAVGFYGTCEAAGAPISLASALYKSLQLFGLNFDLKDGLEPNLTLQIARFGAAIYIGGGAVLLLSRRLREWVAVAWQALAWRLLIKPRAVIIGYGVVGQAAALELRRSKPHSYAVTVFDNQASDADRQARARNDGVLLIGGDADVDASLAKPWPRDADLLVVCLGDDRATLEAAGALASMTGQAQEPPGLVRRGGHLLLQGLRWLVRRVHRTVPPRSASPQIRLLLRDPVIARSVAEGETGLAVPGARVAAFDFSALVAQDLCRRARFDRDALEAGQDRVHIVLFGCGAQGLAILTEVLLTAWRVALAPPRVTVVDRNAEHIEHQLRASAPALFLPDRAGGVPMASRPRPIFVEEEVDHFLADRRRLDRLGPVTAYVFACGDDDTNLRGALGLREMVAQRQCDPRPIYVRLRERENEAGADIGFGRADLLRPFGGLAGIIGRSGVLAEDVDWLPRRAHAVYQVPSENPAGWDDLDPPIRAANRPLYRNAAQKLEDLGLQWPLLREAVPIVLPDVARSLLEALDRVDFDQPHLPARRQCCGSDVERLTAAAEREHDRWMTERAVLGWRAAPRVDPALRDDPRRVHPCMHPWADIGAKVRSYDATFLRGLLCGQTGAITGDHAADAKLPWARPKVIARYALAWADVGDSRVWRLVAALDAPDEPPTEIHVAMRDGWREADGSALAAFTAALDKAGPALSRVVLVFNRPSDATTAALAAALAARAIARDIEVSARWLWTRQSRPMTVGFAGHRDLAKVGGGDAARRRLEAAFATLALDAELGALISGYAPGADQLAVRIWCELGLPKPRLIFPFTDEEAGAFITTEGEGVLGETRFTQGDLESIGDPQRASRRAGDQAHADQSNAILAQADRVVVLWDGAPAQGAGGTGDLALNVDSRLLIVA